MIGGPEPITVIFEKGPVVENIVMSNGMCMEDPGVFYVSVTGVDLKVTNQPRIHICFSEHVLKHKTTISAFSEYKVRHDKIQRRSLYS